MRPRRCTSAAAGKRISARRLLMAPDHLADERLTDEEIGGLLAALDDEYMAHATYMQVIADFGEVLPFTNIVEAEGRHIDALARLVRRLRSRVARQPLAGEGLAVRDGDRSVPSRCRGRDRQRSSPRPADGWHVPPRRPRGVSEPATGIAAESSPGIPAERRGGRRWAGWRAAQPEAVARRATGLKPGRPRRGTPLVKG